MARLSDTILQRGYSQYTNAPMVDLRNGAQNGPMTDIASYVSNAAYVRRHLIPLLLEAPRGFQDLENGDLYVATLKALVETHLQSVEGLNKGLTVEVTETAVGGAGEQQEDFTNVTRARSEPSFLWIEKYGMPITTFLQQWITSLIMDPQTKYPTVIANGIRSPRDLLPDYYGMTCIFIEPDPTHQKVMKAWLCTNMFPKATGDIIGRRDLTSASERLELNIAFTALTQVGFGVDAFAQSLLDKMNLTGMNPNLQQSAIRDLDADTKAANRGYNWRLDVEAATHIR